ncbi:hypothetical protein FF1_012808 [Malus domestica]
MSTCKMCSSSLSSIEKRRKKREQPAGGGYGMGGSSSFLQSWADHVYITYRHIASALVMFPFAYVLERKERPKLTFALFLEPFVLSLLGIGLTLNMYFASLRYTSPTFLASIINTIASLTFCNRSCTEIRCCLSSKFSWVSKSFGHRRLFSQRSDHDIVQGAKCEKFMAFHYFIFMKNPPTMKTA